MFPPRGTLASRPPPRAAAPAPSRELEELRRRVDAQERALAALEAARAPDELREMLDTLDLRRDTLADELRGRLAAVERDAQAAEERLAEVEATAGALHEGTELTRVRMRLERIGHTLAALDERLAVLEAIQRSASDDREARDARQRRVEERLGRLESLFEELAQELRARDEEAGLDGIRARLDDVEALVLQAGSEVQEQRQQLHALSESIAPGAPIGDNLTRIKGIGPKYAERLRELGVNRFADVAAWSIADVERVAAHLRIAPARILNARWVERAAELAGEQP